MERGAKQECRDIVNELSLEWTGEEYCEGNMAVLMRNR